MNYKLTKVGAMVAAGALALSGATVTVGTIAGASKMLPTYTIAFQGILSGGTAALGINESRGVKLAAADWNANKNRKFNVKVIAVDDQGDPTVAPSVATGIASNNKVVAVIGPSYSGATIASLPVYGPSGMPIVSPSATRVSITLADPTANPPVTVPFNAQYKDFFRVVANDGVQGPADGNYLARTLKKTNIMVINDASSYGAGLAAQVAAQAKSDGATVTTATLPGTTACGLGGTGANDQITIPSGIDAVFYGGYYCDFAKMTDVVRTAGYKGILMSGDGSEDPGYMADLSKLSDGAGTLLTCACSQVSSTTAAGKHFNAAFKKTFKADPGAYSPESYDATNTVLKAMSMLKKVTRSAITAQLKKISFKGLTKVVKFNSAGDVASNSVFVYQVMVRLPRPSRKAQLQDSNRKSGNDRPDKGGRSHFLGYVHLKSLMLPRGRHCSIICCRESSPG
jgi:branched-chain amino acid transport system substrate-binding protein